jgi:hypothetical protein
VLVMLARAADCARVTKQYELVCKAEISPFARRGTSGVRGSLHWPHKAVKQVRVSDLSGQQAGEEQFARLIIHEHPQYPRTHHP